jgi:hypothetical protein
VGVLQRKAGPVARGAGFAPPVVHDVLNSPGRPLDPETRSFMEPRFAHDFSRVPAGPAPRASGALALVPPQHGSEVEADEVARRVTHSDDAGPREGSGRDFSRIRVHADARAAESACAVGARAYTVGENIVFGHDEYAPETREGKALIAHELAHTVQQQQGGPTVQRAVIDDVREKLSYGFLDWAIRDAEALEALALLSTIPAADLARELAALGPDYVTRLLDNLPDSAKTGEVYRRVLEAAGAAGATPYAVDQLSYGLFDWAVTDEEVTRVFNTLTNLPASQHETFLSNLKDRGYLGRLVSNSTTAHHTLYIRPWVSTLTRGAITQRQRDILRVIVSESPDSALETIKLATEIRFNVTVGRVTMAGRTPADWEAGKLRETYLVLDELPEAHVARNRELLRFGQFTQDPVQISPTQTAVTAGVYDPATRELAVNVKAGDLRHTIVHETGHAVDQEMGWSTSAEPAKPERGGWKSYGALHADAAKDMVDDSNAGIKTKLAAAQRTDVETQMADAMTNRSAATLTANVSGLAWFGALPAPDKTAVLADRALAAVGIGLNQPYFLAADGGEHLGDHIYQESYTPTWVRYKHEARARLLTPYQFRDEGEWFAEAYEFYYRPDSRGRGAALADKDPNTKAYFDSHVHTRAASR